MDTTETDVIRRLLTSAQLWFIVGLRDHPSRAAWRVSEFLQERGKTIVPIHPAAQTVHGQRGYPTIAAAAEQFGAPDVVDMFVRSELVGPLVDEAITADAGAVWLQLGVIDIDAVARAQANGLATVMDRCPAIEWPRLGLPSPGC